MPNGDVDDETYSVIYAALKHPIRRRILRMLVKKELTYTQILNALDVDTGHLNYHLDSLGELLTKTPEGKYRLSEFGKAAVELMKGVEETDASTKQVKLNISKKKVLIICQLLSVTALVLAGVLLMNISYVSTYNINQTSNLDSIIISPNGDVYNLNDVNVRSFKVDTLTTHYREFYQVDIADANVTLQVQVFERIYPAGNIPPISENNFQDISEKYYQVPTLMYNETHYSRPLYPEKIAEEKFSRVSYTITVPLKAPQDKDLLFANSFVQYNTTLTNLGGRLVQSNSFLETYVAWPNNIGFLGKITTSLLIEQTDYPYFYYGISLIVFAAAVALMPHLTMAARKITKK